MLLTHHDRFNEMTSIESSGMLYNPKSYENSKSNLLFFYYIVLEPNKVVAEPGVG